MAEVPAPACWGLAVFEAVQPGLTAARPRPWVPGTLLRPAGLISRNRAEEYARAKSWAVIIQITATLDKKVARRFLPEGHGIEMHVGLEAGVTARSGSTNCE